MNSLSTNLNLSSSTQEVKAQVAKKARKRTATKVNRSPDDVEVISAVVATRLKKKDSVLFNSKFTVSQMKDRCKELGIEINPNFDKRRRVNWMYMLGADVEPILRPSIVHLPKKENKLKKSLSWDQLTASLS